MYWLLAKTKILLISVVKCWGGGGVIHHLNIQFHLFKSRNSFELLKLALT